MNKLPLEIVEKVFEYIPFNEVIRLIPLNDRFEAAATNQLKRRCVRTAAFEDSYESSVDAIFQRIQPNVRHIHVERIHFSSWIPTVIACRNLVTLIIDRVYSDSDGSFLAAAPTSLRTLRFMNTNLQLHYLLEYLVANPNIVDLRIAIGCRNGSSELPVLLKNLQNVRTLGLIGYRLIASGYEHFATLPSLVRLDLQVTTADFRDYPAAIVDPDTQQLRELNIALSNRMVLDDRFAESFRNFTHLTRLTIYIGVYVGHFQAMLPHLNALGKFGKLETLILAGCTGQIGLDENRSQLQHVKHVRVCHPMNCKCTDHSILFHSVAEHFPVVYMRQRNYNECEWN